MRGTLEERFWEKVGKRGPDDCWEWAGSKQSHGYGQINAGGRGRILSAHRVSWELANGPIPIGMCVLHYCDNPGCVNPAHLFLGTQEDNIQDRAKKGRNARGAGIGISKLDKQDIGEIRVMLSRGISRSVISKKYGVTRRTIGDINAGKTWGWLKEE